MCQARFRQLGSVSIVFLGTYENTMPAWHYTAVSGQIRRYALASLHLLHGRRHRDADTLENVARRAL